MRLISLSILAATAAVAACVQTADAPMSIAPTDADRASPPYKACVAAIARTTGRSAADVSVFNFLFSEANTQVEATVAGAEAPWRCLSSNDGVVAEVIYTGSEGAL
ncbi:MAG: hypothetical protein NTW20_03325 [Rhodobacterales bacterium]|nr:hypothetical protein [Rhodobacterales bacterium]